MSAETPLLPTSILDTVTPLPSTAIRVRWYMCVIITLSSLNYPDVIPQVYNHLDANMLSSMTPDDRFLAVRQIREGLIKSTGIVGACRTGNAMRTLSLCIPEELREKDSPRSNESEEMARKRGKEFWSKIYARNPAFDPKASVRASPDYAFIVREVLYARIFSYDGILDGLMTGYAIVSGLYGMDCQNQLQHHMKGMLLHGATRKDLEDLRELCLTLANILGVKFRHGPAPIPTLPEDSI